MSLKRLTHYRPQNVSLKTYRVQRVTSQKRPRPDWRASPNASLRLPDTMRPHTRGSDKSKTFCSLMNDASNQFANFISTPVRFYIKWVCAMSSFCGVFD